MEAPQRTGCEEQRLHGKLGLIWLFLMTERVEGVEVAARWRGGEQLDSVWAAWGYRDFPACVSWEVEKEAGVLFQLSGGSVCRLDMSTARGHVNK